MTDTVAAKECSTRQEERPDDDRPLWTVIGPQVFGRLDQRPVIVCAFNKASVEYSRPLTRGGGGRVGRR